MNATTTADERGITVELSVEEAYLVAAIVRSGLSHIGPSTTFHGTIGRFAQDGRRIGDAFCDAITPLARRFETAPPAPGFTER